MSNLDQSITDLINLNIENSDLLKTYKEDYTKYLKKYDEDQKKITDLIQKNNSLKKSDLDNLHTEIKKDLKSSNQSELTKKDFDQYFKTLNENINNQFSLFEGLLFGCVIMYIFFTRLFNNV